MNRFKLSHIAGLLLLAMLPTGCEHEPLPPSDEGEMRAGDAVTFATYIPGKATKATDQASLNTELAAYKVVSADYEFTVEMYEQGVAGALRSAVYVPTKTIENAGQNNETVTYASDGTLLSKNGSDPLYWPGNAKKYGFKATAGSAELATEQSTAALLLAQDRLLGYGFEPIWDTKNSQPLDNENALNYHTLKEWYAYNKQTYGMVPGNVDAVEFYKKIPLYLQHQRSLITVILKAGEGVDRSALEYEKALANIHTNIYSYGATNKTLTPLAKQTAVDYVSGDFGTAANDVETTQYTAIVEPHDYLTGATNDVIAEIQLSGQRFTFYASNDDQFGSYDANDQTNAATIHMNGYNLTAGKHLVITATLGRASRKILITAYVEDWTEAVTTSIVDDYGQAGDPIQIKSRQELYDFLNDNTKNKPGNVAIIVPSSINLEKNGDADAAWTTALPLNCTLNMAGATFYTNHQVFSEIGSSGNLINGTIAVGNNAVIDAAVATTNLGSIERVDILTTDANNNTSNAIARRAGMVVTNSGSIIGCSSVLPVKATSNFDGFIGGIAAESIYAENSSTMPVIDGCTVNAMVAEADGESIETGKTYGGGIVGQAVGRVTNNKYEYGITIRQNATRLKNIIQRKAGDDDSKALRAYGNSWPTTAKNEIYLVETPSIVAATNDNGTAESDRYTAVIDSQSDLEYLLQSEYNTTTSRIRISNDFAVTGWTLGTKDDQLSSSNKGNIFCELDGNDKSITTDGMLFTNIQNHIYDLTVKLGANLIATHLEDGSEAIATLAYSVYGGTDGKGKISNIKVKGGNYRIQAATVGGIVVWAYDGAVIENCQCKANIQVWTPGLSKEAKTYAGGIAACAAKATFTRCIFHNTDGTLYQNTASTPEETEAGTEGLATGIFYGGILGGTVPKGETNTEYPSVLITDCTSWFSTSGNAQKGAIVGYARYANGNNNANGIADGCQGNWWNTTSDGIGTYLQGLTIEKIIGKRNAVKPTQDSNY